jgi:type IV pilus secretin PilQ/predicted competence protein
MAHTKLIPAFVGRGALVLLLTCALTTFAAGSTPDAPAAPRPPAARSVRAVTSGPATLITIAGSAPMPYSVRRAGERLLVVELPGVDASQLAPAYEVASPLVAGLSVSRAVRAEGPQASLQINLRAPVRERTMLVGNDLVFELLPASEAGAAPQVRPTPTPAPAQDQLAPQPATQGQQYGTPGFVGEPVSLNVVNADIREILNYITEQYGVNFVVDASVRNVAVTINVTDVPWNFALDSILKANRLGIEANGNILRIATLQVLKDEAKIRAEEESARAALRAAQLENAPLVTEFIRLNYARAAGTLAGAHGSAGGFAGGSTNSSYSGGAGGDAAGTGADGGILPIIAKRLSRRGSVEVDGRSNTIIITDVKENVDAIRRLVQLLDQPEPQVEIETRIVIASRNFSRDLGVQLNAILLSSRGGNIGFNTGPGSPPPDGGENTIGVRPGGIPQGILNPTGALGAEGPNTVIGLTTGIFGTAQISALITAAEEKGQAKIVATPRVSALNNRPAQIEAGSQIPVTTPQTGTGGSQVFTTTFVSVPLRLSITPQITDAGTVVLRVVMENNSINLTLTNSLGTPGIDTQRMQTEVLVPDGGTTVVGGVLNDRESETQSRTPGLGSLPIVGNLFKRKAVSRNTDEILFFITPRVYRPDFQGNRVDNTPTAGTRSVQLPQPVPLGNPSSNTPTPPPPAQPGTQVQPTTVTPEAVVPNPTAPAAPLTIGARP